MGRRDDGTESQGPEPAAVVDMIVRAPAPSVFRAFVEPGELTRFWLADASGPLAPGAEVTWTFMVPGASAAVRVTGFDPDRRLAFDWDDALHVTMDFRPYGQGATRLTVRVTGFGAGDLEGVVDVTGGFSIVVCDLKTLLEKGASAGLVRDKAELLTSLR